MIHNKMQFIWSVLLVVFILLIISCLPFNKGQAEEMAFIVEEDITYGKGGDVELKLDLARPIKGRGPFPALVFIHGHGQNRKGYYHEIREAAERGYVAVSVDFRIFGMRENGKVKYPFPAQVQDVKCAVRWLRANARKYKIDPNRIGVVGWSSGGHLSLMLGLTDPSHGLEGRCGKKKYSSRVQAVVSLAGPTELIRFYQEKPKQWVVDSLGGTPEEVPEQYKRASPLTYVSKDDPPVLSVHGEKNHQVPLNQPELLDAKMREVGASHTLKIKKDGGHVVLVDKSVWEFLNEHLKRD